MKKAIIALMGLFTIVACSEDSYQEADKMSGTVQNTESQNSVRTVAPTVNGVNYQSPYEDNANNYLNIGTQMIYTNKTPLILRLYPYAGNLHEQFYSANIGFPNYPNFSTFPGKFFDVQNNSSFVSSDCGGIIPTAVPLACVSGPVMYDFGDVNLNWHLLHHGKIHYFYYEILDKNRNPVESGFIKQRFYDDSETDTNISSAGWVTIGNVDHLPVAYDAVAMFNVNSDEICITQGVNKSQTLPSEVHITDPATGIAHTLKFYTTINDVRVDFM